MERGGSSWGRPFRWRRRVPQLGEDPGDFTGTGLMLTQVANPRARKARDHEHSPSLPLSPSRSPPAGARRRNGCCPRRHRPGRVGRSFQGQLSKQPMPPTGLVTQSQTPRAGSQATPTPAGSVRGAQSSSEGELEHPDDRHQLHRPGMDLRQQGHRRGRAGIGASGLPRRSRRGRKAPRLPTRTRPATSWVGSSS